LRWGVGHEWAEFESDTDFGLEPMEDVLGTVPANFFGGRRRKHDPILTSQLLKREQPSHDVGSIIQEVTCNMVS
jgi:hypothetical protein